MVSQAAHHSDVGPLALLVEIGGVERVIAKKGCKQLKEMLSQASTFVMFS